MASDGQVTFGDTVKQTAKKIRKLDRILAGFAGSAADSFALFSRFEAKLEQYRGNLERSAVELAKDWRSDRMLRRLEAMLIVMDTRLTFLLSGNGDLIEPDDGIIASSSVCWASAFAAAKAYAPPDPIAMIPSSGSMRSPFPESRKVRRVSITISIASRRRSMRSLRQSFASSTADRFEIAAVLLELRLESREQGKRICGGTGEPGQDAVVVQLANLLGGLLDDGVAEGDLTVTSHDGLVSMTHREHGRRVKGVRSEHFTRVYRRKAQGLTAYGLRHPG